MKCLNCSAKLSPNEKFCGECGQPVKAQDINASVPQSQQCSKCGVTVDPQDQFCGECGFPLTTSETVTSEDVASEPPPVSIEPPSPRVEAAPPSPEPVPEPIPAPSSSGCQKWHVIVVVMMIIMVFILTAAGGFGWFLLNPQTLVFGLPTQMSPTNAATNTRPADEVATSISPSSNQTPVSDDSDSAGNTDSGSVVETPVPPTPTEIPPTPTRIPPTPTDTPAPTPTPTFTPEPTRVFVRDVPGYHALTQHFVGRPVASESFSPTGNQIVITEGIKLYTVTRDGGSGDIWMEDDSNIRPIGGAVWSPDGQLIAFMADSILSG